MKFSKKLFVSITFVLIVIIGLSVFYIKPNRIETKIDLIENNIDQVKEIVLPKPTTITSNGLPDSHKIKTTFVPQAPEKDWSEPWQDACEEASLLTVYYYYQHQTPNITEIKNDILKMIDFEKEQDWGISINTDQMSQIVSEYFNLNSKVLKNPTLEQIKTYISQDIPIIVPANGKTLYQENKFFSNGGPYYHNIVILGYDDHKQQFTVHDVGTQHGAYFHYSYNLLMESIHDFPLSQKKEDINSGSKNVLVLIK